MKDLQACNAEDPLPEWVLGRWAKGQGIAQDQKSEARPCKHESRRDPESFGLGP